MNKKELIYKMCSVCLDFEGGSTNYEEMEHALQVVLDNIGHIVETYEVDQIGSFITLKEEFKKG
jgi:hypothetical protein